MASVLISGPAGAGKSQEAKRRRDAAEGPAVIADFQSIVAALLGQTRGPDGTYPERPDWILPIAEYTRRAVITAARGRGIGVVATNSDGDAARRRFLLEIIGPDPGAPTAPTGEIILDPGEEAIARRLAGKSGRLSRACKQASDRWYRRLPRRGR